MGMASPLTHGHHHQRAAWWSSSVAACPPPRALRAPISRCAVLAHAEATTTTTTSAPRSTAEASQGCPTSVAVARAGEELEQTLVGLEQTLEDLELPTFKEKWGIFSVYVLWIVLVSLQLFRVELADKGVPDAVVDVAVSGTTAALALSWDQLVAGPRRNKMARMEATINSKLDLQQQLSQRRDAVEAEIRARLEVNERVQEERALVEAQINAKLDAEMLAFMGLQRQLMQQQQQQQQQLQVLEDASPAPTPPPPAQEHPASSTSNWAPAALATSSTTSNGAPAALATSSTVPWPAAAAAAAASGSLVLPLTLPLDIIGPRGDPATSAASAGQLGPQLLGGSGQQVGWVAGMNAQLTQASFQAPSSSDGSVCLNLQITFTPPAAQRVEGSEGTRAAAASTPSSTADSSGSRVEE